MSVSAYFSSLSLLKLVKNLPGGIAQGLIWGIMALGIYITFRLLDVADLTVDGSFTTGGAVTVMLILAGWPAWAALVIATLAGLLAGLVTGLLHTKLGIPAILAGILTQGSAIRATGNNPAMSRALGINIDNMKLLGLSLSNGMVALSGGLMAQFQGFADVNMGRGAIVIGLAAVIIGEVVGGALLGKHRNFYGTLSFVVVGGVLYYLVIVVVLWLKLNTNDLKLFTAVVVGLFLAVPYLRGQKSSFARLKKKGGADHA